MQNLSRIMLASTSVKVIFFSSLLTVYLTTLSNNENRVPLVAPLGGFLLGAMSSGLAAFMQREVESADNVENQSLFDRVARLNFSLWAAQVTTSLLTALLSGFMVAYCLDNKLNQDLKNLSVLTLVLPTLFSVLQTVLFGCQVSSLGRSSASDFDYRLLRDFNDHPADEASKKTRNQPKTVKTTPKIGHSLYMLQPSRVTGPKKYMPQISGVSGTKSNTPTLGSPI